MIEHRTDTFTHYADSGEFVSNRYCVIESKGAKIVVDPADCPVCERDRLRAELETHAAGGWMCRHGHWHNFSGLSCCNSLPDDQDLAPEFEEPGQDEDDDLLDAVGEWWPNGERD